MHHVELLRRRSGAYYEYSREAFERGDFDITMFMTEQVAQLRVKAVILSAIILDPRVEDALGESRKFKVKLRNPGFFRDLKSKDVYRKYINIFRRYIESNRDIVDKIFKKMVKHVENKCSNVEKIKVFNTKRFSHRLIG